MVVPFPSVLVAPSLKLQATRSPAVIGPAVTGAMARPYGLPPFSSGSTVEPIVAMVFGDSMLRMEGSTVIAALVADPLPPAPMQVRVYMTVPVPTGATVADPLGD